MFLCVADINTSVMPFHRVRAKGILLCVVWMLLLFQRHEPWSENRNSGKLSFEGFCRYLLDKENFALSKDNESQSRDVRYKGIPVVTFAAALFFILFFSHGLLTLSHARIKATNNQSINQSTKLTR